MRLLLVLLLSGCVTDDRPLTRRERKASCLHDCRGRFNWCASSVSQSASSERAFSNAAPGYRSSPDAERNGMERCRVESDMCREECR